jgi:predicted transcriptional regulator
MTNPLIENRKDKIVEKLYSVLEDSDGGTITELVKRTKLNRSAVRTALAKLEGAGKVYIRNIGMAKVYTSKDRR